MVQYLHFRILEFPLKKIGNLNLINFSDQNVWCLPATKIAGRRESLWDITSAGSAKWVWWYFVQHFESMGLFQNIVPHKLVVNHHWWNKWPSYIGIYGVYPCRWRLYRRHRKLRLLVGPMVPSSFANLYP